MEGESNCCFDFPGMFMVLYFYSNGMKNGALEERE